MEVFLLRLKLILLLFFGLSFAHAQPYERFRQNQSYDYASLIDEYKKLDEQFKTASLIPFGKSDVGKDLHVFIINSDEVFVFDSIRNSPKTVVLINNAIHPGEPCGVDASLKLAWQLLSANDALSNDLIIAIIPMYNVGGGLNRACCSRANQNGPEEAGFRGNARNLDLNRDFIKADAKNTRAFQRLYHSLNPDVFIDTHTSNGADYPYVMTLICTQHNKLHPLLGNYQKQVFEPALYALMKEKNYDLCPYVNTLQEVPDSGIVEFMESPRYSTGYTAQFHSFGFVTEAHMLKPFEERVLATHAMLLSILEFSASKREIIKELRKEAVLKSMEQEAFYLNHELDKSKHTEFLFKGYEASYKKSEITGAPRLFYNQDKPFEKPVPFYETYIGKDLVKAPKAYLIPQVWAEVVDRLQEQQVQMIPIERDTNMLVEVYYIDDFKTVSMPYEGHYLHYDMQLRKDTQLVQVFEGDFLIPTAQKHKRFILEVLEPQAIDSYFAWNYFDEILQQKEWFSAYVFEDKALEILKKNPSLKKNFEMKKRQDPEFAANPRAQLYYIYKHSDYYEAGHKRYPVFRLF